MTKRVISVICSSVILLSLFAVLAVTASAAGEGATFSVTETYTMTNTLSSSPLTFEGVVQVPKSVSGRAGVIVGNYKSSTVCVNFEVSNNGAPRFYARNSSGTVTDLTFNSVDIRGNDYVHLAIAIDPDARSAYCYINGELKQTLSTNYTPVTPANPYMVGGDLRPDNARYFVGKIASVALFSDTRTTEQIKSDINKVDLADSALLAAYDLTADGDARLSDLSGKGNTLIHKGGKLDLTDIDGATFTAENYYAAKNAFEIAPQTYEAWVYVPKDLSARAGVITGNYGAINACINFEIYSNGNPRFYYVTADKTVNNYVFKDVDVRTGDWAHLAIVYDSVNRCVLCYLNGALKGTIGGASAFEAAAFSNAMFIGADCRSGNEQYFKGALRSVTLYSDARTADEISKDMTAPDLTDSALLAHYDTAKDKGTNAISDNTSGKYSAELIKTWFSEKEPVTDYAYSFCVIGDTQKVAVDYPDKFNCIYDWIVNNKDEKKISFVFGLGDITDDDTAAEWKVAKEGIFKLNGVVPYSLVRGNHDSSAMINKTFNVPDYTNQLGGLQQNKKIENAYVTFNAGGVDYLNIVLDYGASDALLNWAAGLIESHPNHRVIITTHAYLFRDGTTLDVGDVVPPNKTGTNNGSVNNGDQMWDKLISKYENIFLVLSGHDPCDNIIVAQNKGIHGNTVTQMLIDPQGVDAAQGATGMIAMLYFSNDGKTITVENYSTVRDQFYMSTSQMTIELPDVINEEDTTNSDETTVDNTTASDANDTSDPLDPTEEVGCSSAIGAIAALTLIPLAAITLVKKRENLPI